MNYFSCSLIIVTYNFNSYHYYYCCCWYHHFYFNQACEVAICNFVEYEKKSKLANDIVLPHVVVIFRTRRHNMKSHCFPSNDYTELLL